jgi:hypothetical protein
MQIVETFGSRRSHPSLSDGSGRPDRRTNLPYSEAPHATIEVHAIAAVAIVNQESRWRSIPGAFHDLLRGPLRCRMRRHCNVEDLPVREPDDEEEASGTGPSGHRKSRKPTCSMHAASGTLAMSRLGACGDTRAYIWPRSWRKLETLTAPIQQRMTPIAEPSACQDPKAPIGVAQARPRMPHLQHNQLLPQTEVFRD